MQFFCASLIECCFIITNIPGMHLINLKEKWFHLQKTVDLES